MTDPNFVVSPSPANLTPLAHRSTTANLTPLAHRSTNDRWHAVRVRSGHEIQTADVLRAPPFSLQVYCPRYPATFVDPRSHRRRTVLVPYLSTYLFARWDAHNAYLWHDLRDVRHVLGFVGAPDPVPDAHLNALRDYIGEDGELVPQNDLRARRVPPDTSVLINRGAFGARVAVVVDSTTDNFFVTVKITGVLGRDHLIKLPAEWCDRLPDQSLGAPLATTARSGRRTRASQKRRVRHSSEPAQASVS